MGLEGSRCLEPLQPAKHVITRLVTTSTILYPANTWKIWILRESHESVHLYSISWNPFFRPQMWVYVTLRSRTTESMLSAHLNHMEVRAATYALSLHTAPLIGPIAASQAKHSHAFWYNSQMTLYFHQWIWQFSQTRHLEYLFGLFCCDEFLCNNVIN